MYVMYVCYVCYVLFCYVMLCSVVLCFVMFCYVMVGYGMYVCMIPPSKLLPHLFEKSALTHIAQNMPNNTVNTRNSGKQ